MEKMMQSAGEGINWAEWSYIQKKVVHQNNRLQFIIIIMTTLRTFQDKQMQWTVVYLCAK